MPKSHFPQRTAGGTGRHHVAVIIPALNEEATIASVVRSVPRIFTGVRRVDVIVVDDGSTDATAQQAEIAGADFIVSHPRNRGLVTAFNAGVSAALAAGADMVVNLDADGQHDPQSIPRLLAPLIAQDADIVIGVRPLADASQGTLGRRMGNRAGTWFMRKAIGMPLTDVTSGFRGYTRDALLRLNVITDYTYTLETLIQAARRRLAIAEVEIPARPRQHGVSRMTHSIRRYIQRTGGQAVRTLLHTRPLAVFGRIAVFAALAAVVAAGWFFVGYQDGGMHLPSLLVAVLLAITSTGFFVCGLLADGINSNRRLLEDALHRIKRMEAGDTVYSTQPAEPHPMAMLELRQLKQDA